MKIYRLIGTTMILVLLSCSKNDDTIETNENKAPITFELLGINEGDGQKPLLTWEASTDPDGDPLTYDVIAENEDGISKVVAKNIAGTSFELDGLVNSIGEYSWKVVAKDGKGGQMVSKINKECTKFNTLIFSKTALTKRTPFSVAKGSGGASGGIFVFDSKIYTSGADKREWWQSTNGSAWSKVNLPEDLGTDQAKLLTFKNKLWCISGDGKIVWYWGGYEIYWAWEYGELKQKTRAPGWRLVSRSANFPPPYSSDDYKIVIFKDKIWSIRGTSVGNVGKAWRSTDMVNWTTHGLLFRLPYSEGSTLSVFNGRLWQIGGIGTRYRWSSNDGINWRREGLDFSSTRRTAWHSSVVYDNKLWAITGWGIDGDIWWSSDGNRWNLTNKNEVPFKGRVLTSSVVFNNKVFVVGGYVWYDDEDTSIKTDVWTMKKCSSGLRFEL
ncbi:hypothetical protein FEE95_04730 [Maribacter algarum]|uniref:Fibronectin type-III domain-containing protein n=1 Tax=Maribacter algarum (ex Zhang et al. 2020) TaxID=2578118 RepID=A0A5S3PUQ8_9FLAO|nr:hypothetical protein [Maribacter algarum]TMM58741.1 hypothetical protein FEE95_04730 [Maribacter algarum]